MTAAQWALLIVGMIVGAGVTAVATRHHFDELYDTLARLRDELSHRRGCPLCGDNDELAQ